ncbi:L-2-hydroxyglutarate oxidase [Alteromonas sp. H39]|uniref:L-2-hydroxyglutarate oxidase n=1 Tax=Alteromonas sp. H39 TaxID=3389876 RepID=UPI0039E1D604
MAENTYDLIIVGAGIIGAAVAYTYCKKHPAARVMLMDKGAEPATHQTGRNSGVIHAGVYYPPGSLKAKYCRQGLEDTLRFCSEHDLPVEQCGKLVVATSEQEIDNLNTIFERCQQNDLSPERVSASGLSKMEPHIRGEEAIYVSHTGITDYSAITSCMLEKACSTGALEIRYQHAVCGIEEGDAFTTVTCRRGDELKQFRADKLIVCAGVYADTLIHLQGLDCEFSILPFKGEYFKLHSRFDNITSRLIYPVPDPAMPFLGLHLTRMIGGYTTVGPNAVLAPGKEAYNNHQTSLAELWQLGKSPGLWKLLWKYRESVVSELATTLSKRHYASLIQRYCPAVTEHDFSPFRAGIRAQAVTHDGELVQDFRFVSSARILHVGNAPSPAATSALPIARAILDRAFS